MRKSIMLLFGFLAFYWAPHIPPDITEVAAAQQITNATAVKIVVPYQTTVSSATLSTAITEVSSNTAVASTTLGISQIKVENETLGSTVCCSHSAAVTCNTGAGTDGAPIAPATSATAPKNSLTWAISTLQQFFCTATSANVGVIITKLK